MPTNRSESFIVILPENLQDINQTGLTYIFSCLIVNNLALTLDFLNHYYQHSTTWHTEIDCLLSVGLLSFGNLGVNVADGSGGDCDLVKNIATLNGR
jgi:hypothetical protein